MERVKYKRAARRAQATKLCNEVAELRADLTVTDVTLKALLGNLQTADVALRAVNDEIEPLFGVEELQEEYQGAISYEEKTVKAIVEIQSRLDELRLDPVQTQSGVNPGQSQSGVKLPKLKLQTFSGELTNWISFWEQYRRAVDENARLAKSEKFQYLRTLLKGDAASAIRGLQATAACYDDAIDILKQRFGNTTRIEREHLSRLRKLPPVK
ncbi:uncharacterized protein LOC135384938 [Ornithodoros turicata]|uniref:uncharacterized protein LOC135384938 n=1 Tax=Ornithodoros turicata TaxID=34597 RepID=UPI003139A4A0